MPKKKKRKNNLFNRLFKDSVSPKIGIPLLIIGVLLLISPLLSNVYANYQQAKILKQYQQVTDRPDISLDLTKGAPTGFDNVVLQIPRLDLEVALLGPPETFDGYNPLLLKAPVFYRDSVYPGAQGNVAITAHRIDHGSYFYDLDFMEAGDEIYLNTPGFQFVYTVKESMIIDKTEMEIVNNHTSEHYLVLVTCEPKTTRQATPLRLAVRAELKETKSL